MVLQQSGSESYWQAKVWGLLHDSPLKSLQRSKNGEGPWNELKVMENWQPSEAAKYADFIASASDRAAIDALKEWSQINYDDGLELRHLLSGASLPFNLQSESCLHQWRNLTEQEEKAHIKQIVIDTIPQRIRESEDVQEVFWWLWRCLPEALSRHPEISNSNLSLVPAETRIPDCSIWSHTSMTAALAGSLTGYDGSVSSRPYIVSFTFVPIQEVVKASRKMQDFWAGSWILHYLSASICWAWARKYGPDAIVYPSLYAQPLIDHWLLTKQYSQNRYPHWHQSELIERPSTRRLLTAGFPNVLVAVLPQGKVKAAVDQARRMLTGEDRQVESPWMTLAEEVKQVVFQNTSLAPSAWQEWLASQWQIYWTALPLGDRSDVLARPNNFEEWREKQNQLASLHQDDWLFTEAEKHFFDSHQINIGSWWAPLFDQVRNSLNAVKNPRVWSLPTAFSSRSTISGLGSVVHKQAETDWCSYDDLKQFWVRQQGLFDGREQLNATEVVKRGIKRWLEKLPSEKNSFDLPSDQRPAYPDLTVGAAGWLKCHPEQQQNYQDICQKVLDQFAWAKAVEQRWGIPWIDENENYQNWRHPRLLNSGWLIEDFKPPKELSEEQQQNKIKEKKIELNSTIDQYFPNRNPTDWYVLAAGDGDSMSDWLKGTKMENYQQYVPTSLTNREPPEQDKRKFDDFLKQQKRMGPATHAAFSRSLLDFSNHLVPYLTEQRYAGRVIYAGGDDVLAYTNLWEWDNWLWDIRQCFKGTKDPRGEFDDKGDYWRWKDGTPPTDIYARPLFTLGGKATISFGVVLAHQSVPLAIALEKLWEAEAEAKEHFCFTANGSPHAKDAVQVRVLYGNGNILKATSKFDVFDQWRSLLDFQTKYPNIDLDPALFEQAAQIWTQHPAPIQDAIEPWTHAFCDRRDIFAGEDKTEAKKAFQQALANYLKILCLTTLETQDDSMWQSTHNREILNWLKLAAFVLRNRDIKLRGEA